MKGYWVLLLTVGLSCVAGCGGKLTPVKESDGEIEVEEDAGYMLTFVFDLTGRNRERVLGKNGPAFTYAKTIKDHYFRDRGEAADRVVVSVVGGSRVAPVWDGRVKAWKKDFPTAERFREYLAARCPAEEPGANSYESVATAFDYVRKFHKGKKAATLVFSEMENTARDKKAARDKLVASLRDYARTGGHSAYYWVGWDALPALEGVFTDAGLGVRYIAPDVQQDPVLFTFR
jgi:hypothetical protein